jgi:hypothetical protein
MILKLLGKNYHSMRMKVEKTMKNQKTTESGRALIENTKRATKGASFQSMRKVLISKINTEKSVKRLGHIYHTLEILYSESKSLRTLIGRTSVIREN